jgi:hypothetical protein
MKNKGKVIDVIDVELNQLQALDHVFRVHDKDFNRVSTRNNLMILKFIDVSKEEKSILSLVEKNGKKFLNLYQVNRNF